MSGWWNALSGFQRFFWSLAIPFTLLFIIQMIMLIIGIDNGGDLGEASGDIDADGAFDTDVDTELGSNMKIPLNIRLLNIRNIIIFFTIFSWSGIVGVKNNYSKTGTIIFAIFLGTVVVIILSVILALLQKATESGTMDIRNAIGAEGEVYLTIPESGKGEGKVQLVIQGSLRELEAVSNGGTIKTGTKVEVIGINKNNYLIVDTLKLIEKGEE